MIHKLLQTLGALFAGNYFGGEVSRSLFRTWLFLFIIIFSFCGKSPILRLPHWPKTSWRVSSGPMPLRLPIVPGFSQLVKLISSIESWNRKYETSDIPYLQWTRTQELWEAILGLTTNTIWYPSLQALTQVPLLPNNNNSRLPTLQI